MRKALAEEKGKRKKFIATFVRLGKKTSFKGYSEETILLKNITDSETGQMVTDHCWFSFTKGFEKISLTEGTRIEFEARVKEYRKGYVNRAYNINNSKTDFKLSHPTRIKKLTSANSTSSS
jgi:fructose-1,6-bisphosphatase